MQALNLQVKFVRRRNIFCAVLSLALAFIGINIRVCLIPNIKVVSSASNSEKIAYDYLKREDLFFRWPPDVREKLHTFNSQDLVNSVEVLRDLKKLNKKAQRRGPKYIEMIYNSRLKQYKKYFMVSLKGLLSGNSTILGTHSKETDNPFRLNRTVINKIDSSEVLHFAFVGDSRVRQLFAMFLRTLPDYDRMAFPYAIDVTAQVPIPGSMLTYSRLLGIVVSYTWYPVLRDNQGRNLSDFIKKWLKPRPRKLSKERGAQIITSHPDFLLLGSFVHHMLVQNKYHEKTFLKQLKELVPVLQEISKNCHVVWLNQYPTLEFYSGNEAYATDVHAQKVWHYNVRAEETLRKGGIKVWNSGSLLVEEYIRSCGINRHEDGDYKSYFACGDYVHPGSSAVTDMIQILYNEWLFNKK